MIGLDRLYKETEEQIYTIISIEEEDFGCEGRMDGVVPMVKVFLESSDGMEDVVMMEDYLMYQRRLDEGAQVVIGGDGTLYPPGVIFGQEEDVLAVTQCQRQWLENYLDAVEEMNQSEDKLDYYYG